MIAPKEAAARMTTYALARDAKGLKEAADKLYPPNLIDRFSASFPAWHSRRTFSRYQNTILAGGYDVVQSGRTRKPRKNVTASGHADNAQDDRTLWELRERCRDADRNSTLMHGIVERGAENIAGPEFLFRPSSGDKAFDEDAAAALAETTGKTEYRGLFNFQDEIYLTTRALFTDGDILFNFLSDSTNQAIEAHNLVTPLNGKGWKDRQVIGGVELDEKGRHAAYYIQDPNDVNNNGWISDYNKIHRIDARNANLIANRNRFSQTRGVPVVAPSLIRFESLENYLDNEMIAAEIDACKVFWIKRPKSTSPLPGMKLQNDTNGGTDSETTYDKLLRAEPGMVFDLGEDEEMGDAGGGRPGQSFEPYIVTVMRMIGCCVGYPLELILLDFSRTNYSSARASLLQAYRAFKCWQNFLRDWMIQPQYNWWMAKWLAGDLKFRNAKGFNPYKLEFTPPRWAWVDPYKEVMAYIERIKAGAGTLTEWIADEGKIMEDVFEIRAREIALLKEKLIPSSTLPGIFKDANNSGSNFDNKEADDKEKKKNDNSNKS